MSRSIKELLSFAFHCTLDAVPFNLLPSPWTALPPDMASVLEVALADVGFAVGPPFAIADVCGLAAAASAPASFGLALYAAEALFRRRRNATSCSVSSPTFDPL